MTVAVVTVCILALVDETVAVVTVCILVFVDETVAVVTVCILVFVDETVAVVTVCILVFAEWRAEGEDESVSRRQPNERVVAHRRQALCYGRYKGAVLSVCKYSRLPLIQMLCLASRCPYRRTVSSVGCTLRTIVPYTGKDFFCIR